MKEKVQILTTCRTCNGQAYLPTAEELSMPNGRKYVRHRPCFTCQGSGLEARWIELHDFARMLAASMDQPAEQLIPLPNQGETK